MTAIIPWQTNDSSGRVIRHLCEGKCVILPTETAYEIVASALHPQALNAFPAQAIPAVVLQDFAELFDWMPRLRGAGVRLFRKLGAGPVVLRGHGAYPAGLWSRLPAASQARLVQDDLLAVRWPAQPFWSELRAAGIPLVSASLPGAVDAESAASHCGPEVACVVDAGPAAIVQGAAIVRAERAAASLNGPALTQEQIDELSLCRTLFLCTGNTCRSPLAEALCGRLLAEAMSCAPTELDRHGFCVESAGLAAVMGSAASPDSVTVAADHGADLSQHRSRMVTMDMLLWADQVFTMTASHCYALEGILVGGMTPPRLLSPGYEDIADPIGGELADYRACAGQILACLQERLPEILES